MAKLLLPEIYKVAKSKGAKVSANRKVPKKLSGSPAFVIEYQTNISWPKSKEFSVEIHDCLLTSICLGGNVEPMPDEYELSNTKSMVLYGIGVADGGNYILLIDGNDPSPENPTVYEMDHEVEPDDELTKCCTLLELFKSI